MLALGQFLGGTYGIRLHPLQYACFFQVCESTLNLP
jgi:hypothetical protein